MAQCNQKTLILVDISWYMHKLKSYGISGQVFGLISSFLSNRQLQWMGSLHKNIQSMLEFLKASFLVLHFSYYTLMTFLMILSVILLSMSMILLSVLSVVRHLICGNTRIGVWTESDLRDTVGLGRKWLVDFNAGKINWFRLTSLVTLVLLMCKWIGFVYSWGKIIFKDAGVNFLF